VIAIRDLVGVTGNSHPSVISGLMPGILLFTFPTVRLPWRYSATDCLLTDEIDTSNPYVLAIPRHLWPPPLPNA
jgi:hypothetical protein